MKRKDFIQKGLMGTGIFVASSALGAVVKNDIDELKELEILGFNHIPNTNSKLMANTILHKSETRGDANHGWLHSKHTFSFANYYNPERMHFGVLRVLNDDIVAPGMGFGTHPHDNMEIISIPLEGDLEHKDSLNNVAIIKNGDIQVMSAGTGIQHSEYNKNKDKQVKFLQIWVFPNKKNITPRYDQITLKLKDRYNKLQQIVSPNPNDPGVWIHQNAWFHLAKFDKGLSTEYTFKSKGNGLYVFNLNGDLKINDQLLNSRDGFGIWNTDKISIKAESNTEFLLMEVPMNV
ncbi:MAG: pirin family protein [Saprospiraceae bacterium]|nr:pirin family protein [Saprospiraceae bacterium]MBK9222720.1 pirin family protein [Saprospiraceae bacterium]MBK9720235.1 pirin family protein [Saprospiraceae bacterium]